MYARLIKYLSLALIVCLTACGVIVQWPGSTRSDASAPTLVDLGSKPKDGLPFGMPTNIVPNAIPSLITTLPIPNDGELANSASLSQFVTPLTDDVEGYRKLTYGGGLRRKVVCDSNTNMVISPLGAVVILVGGVWKVYTHTTASTVDPTVMSGGLAASTAYWVYAYDNAGTLDFTVSATAPDTGYRYMSGNGGYFFVSYFSTDGLSNVVKYNQNDLEFRFGPSGPTVLTGGSAMAVTNIATAPYVPTQATSLRYKALINATVAGRYADILDSSGQDPARIVDNGTIQYERRDEFRLVPYAALGYNGVLAYAVSNAATTLSVDLLGFQL